MLSDLARANLGTRVYGLAAAIMGVAGLLWGDFAAGWIPAPATLPGRLVLAYAVGVLLLAGGVLINLPRVAKWGAALLAVVFGVGLVLLDLTRLVTHLSGFDYWESSAEQVAMTLGGVMAFALLADMAAPTSALTLGICRRVFGLCLLIFGAAHFVFADFSATFVPAYLPPSQMFWVYLTGVAQIAAGLAVASDVMALLAARLLTLMYIIFGVLIHAPRVMSAAANHGNWVEFVVNLALVGVAWIVADSLAAKHANQG